MSAELIPGSLQLHYPDAAPDCLNSLALPPEQLLQRMEGNAVWQQQPVMSDADITAEAMRLGLLPVRPPKAAGGCGGSKDVTPECQGTAY